MKTISNFSAFFVVAAVLMATFAIATLYTGLNTLITVKNNDNNTVVSGILVAYADSFDMNGFDTCTDTDNGAKLGVGGTVGFTDYNVTYSNISDSCVNSGTLREYVCARNVMIDINGTFLQPSGYVAAIEMNCLVNGFTACSADLNGAPVIARCV